MLNVKAEIDFSNFRGMTVEEYYRVHNLKHLKMVIEGKHGPIECIYDKNGFCLVNGRQLDMSQDISEIAPYTTDSGVLYKVKSANFTDPIVRTSMNPLELMFFFGMAERKARPQIVEVDYPQSGTILYDTINYPTRVKILIAQKRGKELYVVDLYRDAKIQGRFFIREERPDETHVFENRESFYRYFEENYKPREETAYPLIGIARDMSFVDKVSSESQSAYDGCNVYIYQKIDDSKAALDDYSVYMF